MPIHLTISRRLGAATLIATADSLSIVLPGRQPVELRPTVEDLGEAIDMLIALRRRKAAR